MFQGYSDETFEFFMAIRFNNNTDFFHANHDWYLRGVREPSLALAEALAPVMEELDGEMELRPNRIVSRINRDVRFSRDKSPYRDHIWLSFRRPGEEGKNRIGAYFDVSADGASYGAGLYNDNRPLMNALRREIRLEPERVLSAWEPVRGEFALLADRYKRMAVPEETPEELRGWYTMKGFYFEKPIRDFELLKSPALADEIAGGLRRLKPLFVLMRDLVSIEDEDDAVRPMDRV